MERTNPKVRQKANNTLAFLRRNIPTKCPKKIKEQCFKTLVKPVLEYGCCVWDPHLKTQINNLEKVHKNAARFVTNNYSYTQGSTAQNMKKLGWIPLEEQRARNKTSIFFKAINSQIDIPIDDLKKSNRKTRNSDDQTFIPPSSKNDCHMHSFFPNTVRLWNKLPSDIKSSDNVDTLKHKLQYVTLRSSYDC
ncbi:hypothetical protein F0L74_32775 [Chitinophaga agrisoli]|uniref:Uncharacterized protein n=1 Tax=Chitinophaga agrisoli TaxID=2607653 RepID=A0A5B2VDK2_9BACT|nr:hypothetical protein [Chitinophaga agrisoli]KAA2237151.1 hypothetical protein F0L74_32775 [Chitinophaga agrisoli]